MMNGIIIRLLSVVGSGRKVESHYTTSKGEHIVAERLGRSASVRIINITQRAIRLYDLLKPVGNLFVGFVSEISRLLLDFLHHFTRHEWATLRDLVARRKLLGK